MRKESSTVRLIVALLLGLLGAACGGGGGSSGSSSPPPPSPPPPPPPPPAPTVPELARPISPALLCSNGLKSRFEATSADRFDAVEVSRGISHWHSVESGVWTRTAGSIESVMRTAAVVAAETNDDCWTDLIFTTGATGSAQLVRYENRNGEGFSQTMLNLAASTDPVAGAGIADLDGDYRLDLALGFLLAGGAEIHHASAGGGFELAQTIATSKSTFGFAFGDYSGDEWLDVFAAQWDVTAGPPYSSALLENVGSGAAQPAGTLVGADATAGTTADRVSRDFNLSPGFTDLDGDLSADLLIASDFGTSEVLLNGSAGAFSAASGSIELSDENAAGQAIRDFDNDGRWDWFVASVHGPDDDRPWPWGTTGNKMYWGTDVFPYLTAAGPATGAENAEWPWGVCAEDFDNDGLTDLFVENGFGFAPDDVMTSESGHPFVQQINESLLDRRFTRARLFMNQGGRSFVDESSAWGITSTTNGRGVACLDYDRDGDIDIAVAQNSGPALLYENRHSAADGNNFVSVSLTSVEPNTHAVGAVVTVVAGGSTQMRQAGANSNFLGQNADDLHFGLGSATVIDEVRVQWPDGTMETYTDLPVNGFLTLLDPRLLSYPDVTRRTRMDDAISAAVDFVVDPSVLAEDLLLGLSWMQRMHGLSLPYSSGAELNARTQQYEDDGQADLARTLRVWRRSYDPGYLVDAIDFGQLEGYDAVTFAGVYCHQFSLGNGYVQDLNELTSLGAEGGYDTTHALLALLWAIDNDCAMPPGFDPDLLSDTVVDLYAIADDSGSTVITDLRVEAMAFLAAAGRHDLVEPEWIDQLLDAQLVTGAWKGDPSDADSSDHTTGLALWLLLQLTEDVKVLSGFVAQDWDP